MSEFEKRMLPAQHCELRAVPAEEGGDQNASPRIAGYGAVFNQRSDLLGGFFVELIAPGAFDEVLGQDVRGLFNHDPNYLLGRTVSGTLRLSVDQRGLAYEIDTPNTQTIRDLVVEPLNRLIVQGTGAAETDTAPAQPKGLETAVGVGKVTASASQFTWQEVNGLIHSVDPAYRAAPNFRLAFNDNTCQAMEEMVDGNKRPLWLPGIDSDRPATILKQQYVIDQAIADIGAGKKFMYAGDFNELILRAVRSLTLKRLVERYAEFGQVGFLAFLRFGIVLQDTAAIKALAGKGAEVGA